MVDISVRRCEKRPIHGGPLIALIGRSLLLLCLLGIAACASYKYEPLDPLDMGSYDPSYDQKAIASYYRNQSMAMREKAAAQATAAAHYEQLFGADSDLVSGARSLARYYENTARELELVAEAHASGDRTRRRPTAVP